jgi:putative inorganic carbon (HCO3(-)) transporter
MRDIVIIFIVIILLITSLTSRFAGALSYWWFSIFRPHEFVWMDISSFRLTMVATILFIVPCIMQGLIPSLRNSISAFILLFLSLAGLASLVSNCEPIGLFRQEYLFNFTVTIVAVLFTIKVVDSANRMFALIIMIAAIIGFHAGKAGLKSMLGMGGSFAGAGTMGGMFSGSNAFALGSATLLFFLLNVVIILSNKKSLNVMLLLRKFPRLSKYAKLILPIVALGVIFNVISLSSRGSALSMFAGIALWLWLSSLIRLKTILIGCVLFIGILSFVDLPDGYTDRLSSAFVGAENLDESAASRPYFWNIAVDIVNDYPLGVGPGCYNTMYNFYDYSNGQYGSSRTVHSSHFEVLSEVGYIATVVWILLFVISIMKCWKIKKAAKRRGLNQMRNIFSFHTSIMLIVAIFVYFLGSSFYALAYNPVIWLLFGMVVMLENIQRTEADNIKGN